MKHLLLLLAPLFALTACTSIQVRPVPPSHKITSVVIQENPKVEVRDFIPALQSGFARHGIHSQVIAPGSSASGKYMVTYVAYRSWDIVPYMSQATITITKDNQIVGHAEYHLRGKGGLSPAKFDSAQTKMNPVIDQLLSGVSR